MGKRALRDWAFISWYRKLEIVLAHGSKVEAPWKKNRRQYRI
jgi:hypothetical protein